MAKRHRPIRIAVKTEGDGPLRFPGAPCNLCGKPVTTMRGNPVVVLESTQGTSVWSARHSRCARRETETRQRRAR